MQRRSAPSLLDDGYGSRGNNTFSNAAETLTGSEAVEMQDVITDLDVIFKSPELSPFENQQGAD